MEINEKNVAFFENYSTKKLREKIAFAEDKVESLEEHKKTHLELLEEKKKAALEGLREKYNDEKKYVKQQFDGKIDDVEKGHSRHCDKWKTSIVEMKLALENKRNKKEEEKKADEAEAESVVVEQV